MAHETFVDMLRGNTNSLGRALEVFEIVKKNPDRLDELFETYFQSDEWVKLRTSNVFRRLWREDTSVVVPYLDKWISKVSELDQPSVQWTFAQLTLECREHFNEIQHDMAIESVKHYLQSSDDWIVLNASIETLSHFAKEDEELKEWLLPHLKTQSKSSKGSVAKRASKHLKALS